MVINGRRVVALLPVYVLFMILVDLAFSSAGLDTDGRPPLWVIMAFIVMATAFLSLVTWFVVQRTRGKITVSRGRVYLRFIAVLIIADLINDALRATATLVFHSESIWVSIPIYIISYAVLWIVFVLIMSRAASEPAADNSE